MGCNNSSENGSTAPKRPQPSGSPQPEEQITAEAHDHGVDRKLDLLRDTPDSRDWIFDVAQHVRVRGTALSFSVDLRPAEGFKVYDQGNVGSCTANALTAAFHFNQVRERLEDFQPSRLFVYYNERAIKGSIASDSGASLRDGIKALVKWGVCDEKLWPYDASMVKEKPTSECFEAAAANRCLMYARVEQTLESLKGCLQAGFPFVFGMLAMCEFMAGDVRETGKMDWPPQGVPHGGHAVQACGYDDAQECFIVRNSWGEEWGDRGHFYMPYKFITHQQLCHDFWTIVFVDGTELPRKPDKDAQFSVDGQEGVWAKAPRGGAGGA